MSHCEYDERGRLLCGECDAEAGCYPERVQSSCVCGETSCRNCPEHSEPEPEELREAALFRMRRLSRHLCSQATIDPGDSEYSCPPQWVRDPPALPCPHGRSSWQMCPHCLGLNAAPYVHGEWTITRTGPA